MDHNDERSRVLERLFGLLGRVYSSTDTAEVLEEIVHGVTDVLGYGVAAIARLEGDELVMTAVSGPEDARQQILGRRRPASEILDEFRQSDKWGILRFVPHGRMTPDRLEAAWLPEFEPGDAPDAWHPEDALYAPLYNATGELLGNMAVDLPPGNRVPSKEGRELLELFAVQAGLALSNATQRERMRERVRLADAVRDVATEGRSTDIAGMLRAAAEATFRGFGATQVWLRAYADAAGSDEVAAGYPRPNGVRTGSSSLRADVERQWLNPVPVIVEASDTEHPKFPNSLADLHNLLVRIGADRLVLVPVGMGLDLLGYIALAFPQSRERFTQAETDALSDIAREIGRRVHAARILETEQRLVAELREVDRYKQDLIATISHELRTPLTTIVGQAELLGEQLPDSRAVGAIQRNAMRLGQLVSNLLDYSKVHSTNVSDNDVDLAAVCQGAVDLAQAQADTAGVVLEFVGDCSKSVMVRGDEEQLRLVLDNLVANAVKYSSAGGHVRVVGSCDAARATVVVSDEGMGISPEDQAHVFSAFQRSSNPEALAVPGTGLGLAISRRIVEAHGGRIHLESKIGEGSTFTLVLPLARR